MIKKKTLKSRNRGKLPQLDKSIYKKPRANMILDCFPLRLGTKQECPLLPVWFSIVLELIASAIRQLEEIEACRLESKD